MRGTRKTAALVILLLPGPATASAQLAGSTAVAPYTFVAPGGASFESMTLHLGGGMEVIGRSGLGAGFELGYVGPIPDGFDYGIGVFSGNVVQHLGRPAARRIAPFVTGGYSLAFRSSSLNLVNLGGGFNYWLREGMALRIEVRDHFRLASRHGYSPHLWSIRVGATWRH
jgi:hypothetical protein